MHAKYQDAAQAIAKAESVIAVTGAGVSVESGIPDFRSTEGLWAKYPPEEYATTESFHADPDKAWEMWYALVDTLESALPNPGHLALAELEALGRLKAVITPNIDNLHAEAGNTCVIEYHGNASWMSCTSCFRGRPVDMMFREVGAPFCECGGSMKPDVVLFGEDIPRDAQLRAQMLAQSCNVLIVIGTSAQVYPANSLPEIAKNNGAFIIECNLEPTDFTGTVTDAFLQGPSGETLPELVCCVKQLIV